MPEPVEYRIVQNLKTALQSIAVAAGFHYTVAALAVKMDADHSIETLIGDAALRPFLVLEVSPDLFEYKPSNRAQISMPMTIHAVHKSDLTVDEDWVRTYYRLCADVEKAIVLDHRRGGLATDTRIATRAFETFNGNQVWAQVGVLIDVPRIYGAPNG